MSLRYVIGVAVLVFCVLLFLHKKKELVRSPSTFGNKIPKDASAPQTKTKPKPHPPSVSYTAPVEAVRKALGLKTVKLNQSGRNASLWVTLETKKRCGGGDLDGIKVDLERDSKLPILLTVEPLRAIDEKHFPPIVRHINAKQLFDGARIRFTLPRSKQAVQFGVYLCNDPNDEMRCSGKPPTDLNAIFARVNRDRALYRPTEALYFFQYLILEPDGTLSMLAYEGMPADTSNTFQKFMTTTLHSREPASDLKEQAQSATKKVFALRPLALQQAHSGVRIILPKFDASACNP